MGYYNPIHRYGTARFAKDAAMAGVDGLITVDLPPEEDEVLRVPAAAQGLDVIRLAAPTTDARRLPTILDGASGFLYYVSIAGVTGTKTFSAAAVREAVAKVKAHAQIPCAVGFGIKTPEQAAEIARFADGAVVGSAIVALMAEAARSGPAKAALVENVVNFCGSLADSVHAARREPVVE
jgi:tryptophan synthase alpha chain